MKQIIEKQKNSGGVRYCSFRDGSCPYGEKCRFQHGDEKVYFQSHVTAAKKRSAALTGFDIVARPKSIADSLVLLNQTLEQYVSTGAGARLEFPTKLPRIEISSEDMLVQFAGEPNSHAMVKYTMTTEESYSKMLK